MDENLCAKTNKDLFNILKTGILQEKKEIAELKKKEKNFNKLIASKIRKIKREHLVDKQNEIKNSITEYGKLAKDIQNDITEKKKTAVHYENAVKSLQKEIASKRREEERTIIELNKELLEELARRKNDELIETGKQKEKILKTTADLNKEKLKISKQINDSVLLAEKELAAEKEKCDSAIKIFNKSLTEFVLKRQEEISSLKQQVSQHHHLLAGLEKEKESIKSQKEKKFLETDLQLKLKQENFVKSFDSSLKKFIAERKDEIAVIENDINAIVKNIEYLNNKKKSVEFETVNKYKLADKELVATKEVQSKALFSMREKLDKFAAEKNQELQNLKNLTRDIEGKISSFNKEKNQYLKELEKAKNILNKEEYSGPFQSVFSYGKNKIEQYKDKISVLKKNNQREKEKTEKELNKINNEISSLENQKLEIKNNIAKKEANIDDTNLLNNKIKKHRAAVNSQIKNLEKLKKQISDSRNKLENISKIVYEEGQEIESNKELKKTKVKILGEELKKLLSDYENREKISLANKRILEDKISKIESRKKLLWQTADKDKVDLNKIKDELYLLEEELKKEEKIDHIKAENLLRDINLRKNEVERGESNLDKINTLLQNVKKLSLESPDVVSGFKKEESKIKANLEKLQKDIFDKIHELDTVKDLFLLFKKNVELKKKNILELQSKKTKERKKHIEVLSRLNQSLADIQSSLTTAGSSIKNLEDEKSKNFLLKQSELSDEILKINKLLAVKSEALKKRLSEKVEADNNIKRLAKEMNLAAKTLEKSRNLLSNYSKELKIKKEQQAYIDERRRILARLEAKTQQNKESEENLLADLENCISEVQNDIKQESERKIKGIEASIEDEKAKRDSLRKEELKIEVELKKQKKKLLDKKQRLSKILEDLSREKHEAIKKESEEKINEIEKEIISNKNKSSELHLLIKDKENVLAKDLNAKARELKQKAKTNEKKLESIKKEKYRLIKKKKSEKISEVNKKMLVEKKQMEKMKYVVKKKNQGLLSQIDLKKKVLEKKEQDSSKKLASLKKEIYKKIELEAKKKTTLLNKKLAAKMDEIKGLDNRLRKSEGDLQKNATNRKKAIEDKQKEFTKKINDMKEGRIKGAKMILKAKKTIPLLNRRLESIGNRLEGLKREKADIENIFRERDNQISSLREVVKEKLKRNAEKAAMNTELDQIRMIIKSGLKTKKKHEIIKSTIFNIKEKKDMVLLLRGIDGLLGKLPQKDIDNFAKSNNFKVYKKIMSKYGVK